MRVRPMKNRESEARESVADEESKNRESEADEDRGSLSEADEERKSEADEESRVLKVTCGLGVLESIEE
eukprot:CAMPEP_0175927218 /NCGR_PEP_ID=MMETSP0108-20121206/16604_1 /TAXON_ID=195067 ORGANISM="Goniomonas pacifica, Strain CCMP1869" /NCGR_SAMPLE_ID=MMETSP0108 /ASSEMBLY_ACC=CAM_ASM_000204 /LENGTH=68 /DNA_ID=CAMNT_0017250505 /DNA_START=323 /DNA_END=531 /DNA_ORIENTATION=+